MDARQHQVNQLLTSAINVSGGIEGFFEGLFTFLAERTDFYSISTEKDDPAQRMVDQAYAAAKPRALKRLAEERERRRAQDAERKAKAQREEEQPRVYEVFDDEEKAKDDAAPGPAGGAPAAAAGAAAAPDPASTAAGSTSSDDDAPPPKGNGGQGKGYTWTQTLPIVELAVPLGRKVASRDCKVVFGAKNLSVKVAGKTLVGGPLSNSVKPADCMWTLEDGNTLVITLEKSDNMGWWSHVIEGDPKIDTQKIVPENSKLSDLDPELRSTVEKMMYDQEMKSRGLPTSDQCKQAQMFEQFKKAHPELDFSKAKINFGGGNDFGGSGFSFPTST